MREADLTVGTRRVQGCWHIGVLRRGRTIVVECGHQHANRDCSTKANGTSAADCIRLVLRGARNNETAEHIAKGLRDRWLGLARCGMSVGKTTLEKARVDAEQAACAYETAVAKTRELLAVGGTVPVDAG